jgi:hypothetical protein
MEGGGGPVHNAERRKEEGPGATRT